MHGLVRITTQNGLTLFALSFFLFFFNGASFRLHGAEHADQMTFTGRTIERRFCAMIFIVNYRYSLSTFMKLALETYFLRFFLFSSFFLLQQTLANHRYTVTLSRGSKHVTLIFIRASPFIYFFFFSLPLIYIPDEQLIYLSTALLTRWSIGYISLYEITDYYYRYLPFLIKTLFIEFHLSFRILNKAFPDDYWGIYISISCFRGWEAFVCGRLNTRE